MMSGTFIPSSCIRPEGWLKTFLHRDLDGITGHLDEYAPEVGGDIFGNGKKAGPELTAEKPDKFKPAWWDGSNSPFTPQAHHADQRIR
ncbi:MAG: hypothetical protein FWF29_04135 [Treponema sp.]|nr:hypothetical protein [Treponema sp.]